QFQCRVKLGIGCAAVRRGAGGAFLRQCSFGQDDGAVQVHQAAFAVGGGACGVEQRERIDPATGINLAASTVDDREAGRVGVVAGRLGGFAQLPQDDAVKALEGGTVRVRAGL